MTGTGLRTWVGTCSVAAVVLMWSIQSRAIPLDKEGDIKLGVRTYVNARVGTENTDQGPLPPVGSVSGSDHLILGTFPHSPAGHLRQNRAFIEVELNHELNRLVKEGVGPLSLINDLPFRVRNLAYHVTFRGEGEGLYDWGPREYSTASEFHKVEVLKAPLHLSPTTPLVKGQGFVDVGAARRHLRKLGTDRERLFQAYVEGNFGSNLFVRFGRQILSWGETDGFQLLDHINPLDSSFGGFLISLDERRIPLDMLLGNYLIGDFGPISEMYLEAYIADDNKVGFHPGTPAGSPWTLPSLGAPDNNTETVLQTPTRTLSHPRGGALLKFNAFDATFSVAHYYTYFDTEALQAFLTSAEKTALLRAFPGKLPCPDPTDVTRIDPSGNSTCGSPVRVVHSAPQVQVSGASGTFAVPSYYSIVRSEIAYFKDEPAFTQGQLDPFIFNPPGGTPVVKRSNTGGRILRDSFNAVVGIDSNQWIRFLNPYQTFFISTQFFYKHIIAPQSGNVFLADGVTPNPNRLVLPITVKNIVAPGADAQRSRTLLNQLEPIYIGQPNNQFLQTLFIGTSYRSGTVNPGLTVFYDWGGAFVYQPAVTLSHDPFRFEISFSVLDSHRYKGGSGVSLLKDRDNVEFRFEYVI